MGVSMAPATLCQQLGPARRPRCGPQLPSPCVSGSLSWGAVSLSVPQAPAVR